MSLGAAARVARIIDSPKGGEWVTFEVGSFAMGLTATTANRGTGLAGALSADGNGVSTLGVAVMVVLEPHFKYRGLAGA